MKRLIVAITLLVLTGCGSDSNNKKVGLDSTNIRMEQGKVYRVYKGDKIENISPNPKIKVDANLTSGISRVTLLAGEAAIVRKKSK